MKRLLLLLTLVVGMKGFAQQQTYQPLYQQAFALYQKGEKQKALEIFEKIFAEDANETNALYYKTVLYTELRQFGKAASGYTLLCQLFPDNANFWGYGSFAYTLINKPGIGETYATKAIELDPYSYQHALHMAHACLFQTKTTQAVYWYQRALHWTPSLQAFEQSFIADFNLFDSLQMMPKSIAQQFKDALQQVAGTLPLSTKATAALDSVLTYHNKKLSNEEKDKVLAWKRAFLLEEPKAAVTRYHVLATFYTDVGLQEYRDRNRAIAISDYFSKAEEVYEQAGDSLGLASLLIQLSREMLVYQRMENRYGKNADPLRYAQRAANIIDEYQLEALRPLQLHYMAEAYFQMEEDSKGLQCYWQQLKEADRLKDAKGYFRATNSLAVYYGTKKQIDSALYYHQLCLNRIDEAVISRSDKIQIQLNGLDYLFSGGRYREVIRQVHYQLPELKRSYQDKYSDLCELTGECFEKLGNTDSAYAYYVEAVQSFMDYSAALESKANTTLPLQLNEERIGSLWGLCAIAAKRGNKEDYFRWSEMSKDNNLRYLISMDYQPRQIVSLSQAMQQLPRDAVAITYTGSNNEDHATALAFTNSKATMASIETNAFYKAIQQRQFPATFSRLQEIQSLKAASAVDSASIAASLPIMHFYYQSNVNPAISRSHIAVKKSVDSTNKAVATEKNRLSQLLYETYIQPFESLLQGKKTIYICGDFLQHFIPFETLRMQDGRYLVEQYNIVYVPSFTIYDLLGKRQYTVGNRLLAAGNPDYASYHPERLQGRAYDFSYWGIKSWADLPGTQKELGMLGNIFDTATVISQQMLSETKLKKMSSTGELKQAAILHFALHGISGTASAKEDNSLAITEPDGGKEDGLLQFYEAYELDISPQLVCLSACETALGMMDADGSVTTMGTAFLAAGAKAVLATNWSIDDEATALFMKAVYSEAINSKTPLPIAVANTKRKFISGAFGNRYKDPFYWAPFKYIGY